MSLASRMMERFRGRLKRFVEAEKAQAGCAKKGLASAAKKLGMSVVNVYRVMNGYGTVKVQMHHHGALILNTILAKAPKIVRKRTARCGTVAPIENHASA